MNGQHRVCDALYRATDGVIVPGRGVLLGARLRSGSTAASATLYNGTDATGDVVAIMGVDAAALIDEWQAPHETGVRYDNSIYVDLTGTGPDLVVYVGKLG